MLFSAAFGHPGSKLFKTSCNRWIHPHSLSLLGSLETRRAAAKRFLCLDGNLSLHSLSESLITNLRQMKTREKKKDTNETYLSATRECKRPLIAVFSYNYFDRSIEMRAHVPGSAPLLPVNTLKVKRCWNLRKVTHTAEEVHPHQGV